MCVLSLPKAFNKTGNYLKLNTTFWVVSVKKKKETLEATRCCLSQNVPHGNLCSISSNPSLIPMTGFCGHFSVTGIPDKCDFRVKLYTMK